MGEYVSVRGHATVSMGDCSLGSEAASRIKYSGSKSARFFSGPTSIRPCLLSGRRPPRKAMGLLMFISRSLGPKKRILGRLCCRGAFSSSIGRMTVRSAFVRRKRWKKVMIIPDEKRDASATLELSNALVKSRRRDWTSTGMTRVLSNVS